MASSPLGRGSWVVLWTLLALGVLDIGLGISFGVPADPRAQASPLQTYFNYGRSLQGKLRTMVAADDEHSAPIVRAGWIDSGCSRPVQPAAGALGLSIYGNSFAVQLADQLDRIDPSIVLTRYGGPGAPPTHSYACFVKGHDAALDRNPIQVIGVTALSLPRMETIWGVTTSFEYPQPFTFPRYRLSSDGELTVHEPSVRSAADLRRVLSNEIEWNAWLAEVESEDDFYSRSFSAVSAADYSVIGRMIRRSFAQGAVRARGEKLRGTDGRIASPGIVDVLPALIFDFAAKARRAGQQPIVVLFEEYGQGGILEGMLRRVLSEQQIDYVSSNVIAPAADLQNFAPDGHFTPAVNVRLAQAVLDLARRAPAKAADGRGPRRASRD